jgi:hypothetical protein
MPPPRDIGRRSQFGLDCCQRFRTRRRGRLGRLGLFIYHIAALATTLWITVALRFLSHGGGDG